MADEAKETKAEKLAAARKKLKAYQNRNTNATSTSTTAATIVTPIIETLPYIEQIAAVDSMSSSLSEKSDFELISNGHELMLEEKSDTDTPPTPKQIESILLTEENCNIPITPSVASYFGADPPNELFTNNSNVLATEQAQHMNALQVIIAEKAQLTSELNKYRHACREKDLELEELRTQYETATQRQHELQERCQAQERTFEQLRNSNAELQHKLAQANAQNEDQTSHLNELQQQLSMSQVQSVALEQQLKEQRNELEMTQIRLRQLDDESSISKDNRVEALTQTQFMYEQQIRDLQAMVQQLNQDKEQANTQYQNYVQHLNAEVSNSNEKNTELSELCNKLQERERQLVEHISGLEREIQKNISRQQEFQTQAMTVPATTATELENLRSQIDEFELERHEFRLKIKSQEDRLLQLQTSLQQSQDETNQLREQLQYNAEELPDQTKLLATMESDKIAASRALTQNVTLKQQLSELEERFVQLTNDKAELVNQRDAEEFANREMRNNYAALEQRLSSIDERLKFKDEEMIRLSHENVELEQKYSKLLQKLDGVELAEVDIQGNEKIDSDEHGHHHHDHHDHEHHDHEHNEHEHHDHEHHDHKHHHHHDHVDGQTTKDLNSVEKHTDFAAEAKEDCNENIAAHHHVHEKHEVTPSTEKPHIPSTVAVEKLEQRFTQLILQVADLTDEKQRLEHLVQQLQSETETVGEYIALYQTQRRMLKQREYEKAAQMQLLHEERERLRDRINQLNTLVCSLGVELPPSITSTSTTTTAAQLNQSNAIEDHLNAALAESISIEPNVELPLLQASPPQTDEINRKLQAPETQEILMKIQHIISEIKENTEESGVTTPTIAADHLNCCLGKFEVV